MNELELELRMFKKLLSTILSIFIFNLTFLPVIAKEKNLHDEISVNFITELNVNKSSKGQIVQFISTDDYTDALGHSIPKGTIFQGKIKSIKHSRWGFRRAKAHLYINQMILPNGEKYKIKAFTKPLTVKGSAVANVGKGILMTPIAVCSLAVGTVAIIVESISIVGIILIAPTGAIFNGIAGKVTNGVNCYIPEGKKITIKFKHNPPTPIIQSVSTQDSYLNEQNSIHVNDSETNTIEAE